jgi:hypothetical protein
MIKSARGPYPKGKISSLNIQLTFKGMGDIRKGKNSPVPSLQKIRHKRMAASDYIKLSLI